MFMPPLPEGLHANGKEISHDAAEMARSQADVPDHVRVKNRRKRYLDTNPSYFGPHLELADPLLYDRLIRRFQTTVEREQEGRKKGYSGTLEADLYRSEAKMEALRNPDANSAFSYKRGANGEILQEEKDEIPTSKEEGYARWKWEMERRFIRGDDDDFDYGAVDSNDVYDDKDLEDRDAQDAYFDKEEPLYVVGEDAAERTKSQELKLGGETGVQDY